MAHLRYCNGTVKSIDILLPDGQLLITANSQTVPRERKYLTLAAHMAQPKLNVEFRTEPKRRRLYVRVRARMQQLPKFILCSAVAS